MSWTEVSTGHAGRGILDLADPASEDAGTAGAKAAALARARRAGLPVLDGFVVTTAASRALTDDGVRDALRAEWARLSADGGQPLVVRSSSPAEDGRTTSMAGRFTSLLDVRGWEAFLDAAAEVVASGGGADMAVLVQPFLEAQVGGVLFGADPVTGRRDRLVVAAVPGGPDRLVSGAVDGTQLALSPHGRLLHVDGEVPPLLRRTSARRHLVRLAGRAARIFGGPQDIEWAVDTTGRLILLQSRPITTLGTEVRAEGPVLGPGPVAETFPQALSPLEEDLWLPPLREGLRQALLLSSAAPARRLRHSPLVVSVGGRLAVDLDLLGMSPLPRRRLARLDPRPPARRLRAAWRVGRLRAGLPGLIADVLDQIDADLRAVPALHDLGADGLGRLLRNAGDALVALHGYEVLAGQLLRTGDTAASAAAAALRVLAAARAAEPGATTEQLVARHPVLLALTPPAIAAGRVLPDVAPLAAPAPPAPSSAADDGTLREALRLRIRWVHELSARAALAAGDVLAGRGRLAQATDVASVRLADLLAVLDGATAPVEPVERVAGAPLPVAFRLAGAVVVPIATGALGERGRGAGGGRRTGRVHIGVDHGPPPPGSVLVVTTLDPSLAPLLPGLGGLVSETGSVLSHLAIVARELDVPTVVGMPAATERLAAGSWVVVDGSTGEVTTVDTGEWEAA